MIRLVRRVRWVIGAGLGALVLVGAGAYAGYRYAKDNNPRLAAASPLPSLIAPTPSSSSREATPSPSVTVNTDCVSDQLDLQTTLDSYSRIVEAFNKDVAAVSADDEKAVVAEDSAAHMAVLQVQAESHGPVFESLGLAQTYLLEAVDSALSGFEAAAASWRTGSSAQGANTLADFEQANRFADEAAGILSTDACEILP